MLDIIENLKCAYDESKEAIAALQRAEQKLDHFLDSEEIQQAKKEVREAIDAIMRIFHKPEEDSNE